METDDKVTRERENDALRAELAQQKRLVAGLAKQVGLLLEEVARLGKKKPDPRKKAGKEKAGPPDETAEAEDDPPKPPTRTKSEEVAPTPGPGPRRGPLPAHLERDVEPRPLDSRGVACCAVPVLETRDPIIREQRDYVPATVRVKRIELHRAQCLCCGTMHTAAMPPVAMSNGSMTAALLAYVVHGKCGMHLPLIRMMNELATKGLTVAKACCR